MEKYFSVISLIITVPIAVGIFWLAGIFFRAAVLNHNVDKGNKFVQVIISIAIGVLVVLLFGIITHKLGCTSDDSSFFRE